jgi:hypothetical protein
MPKAPNAHRVSPIEQLFQVTAMIQWLMTLFGIGQNAPIQEPEYEPVYGLPKRAVEQWLAYNPDLRREYEVMAWLARNPPLWRKYQAARKQANTSKCAGIRHAIDEAA